MSATKILWGQIVVVFAIVLTPHGRQRSGLPGSSAIRPNSDHPWFELGPGVPVYLPPAFFWWWYAYDAYAPHVFVEGAYIAASGGFISIAAAISHVGVAGAGGQIAATYGSARWATARKSRPPACSAPDGVVLGQFDERLSSP